MPAASFKVTSQQLLEITKNRFLNKDSNFVLVFPIKQTNGCAAILI